MGSGVLLKACCYLEGSGPPPRTCPRRIGVVWEMGCAGPGSCCNGVAWLGGIGHHSHTHHHTHGWHDCSCLDIHHGCECHYFLKYKESRCTRYMVVLKVVVKTYGESPATRGCRWSQRDCRLFQTLHCCSVALCQSMAVSSRNTWCQGGGAA